MNLWLDEDSSAIDNALAQELKYIFPLGWTIHICAAGGMKMEHAKGVYKTKQI